MIKLCKSMHPSIHTYIHTFVSQHVGRVQVAGRVFVDEGAAEAVMTNRKSLLAAGVRAVQASS